MGEATTGYIVDTNVFVSKRLKALEKLQGKLYVTVTVIYEYLVWALTSRNKMLGRGLLERARGYERLIEMFPRLLEALGIGVIHEPLDYDAVAEVARLVLERGVDVGDALLAVTARRLGFGVVSLDRDWERLRDYVRDLVRP